MNLSDTSYVCVYWHSIGLHLNMDTMTRVLFKYSPLPDSQTGTTREVMNSKFYPEQQQHWEPREAEVEVSLVYCHNV